MPHWQSKEEQWSLDLAKPAAGAPPLCGRPRPPETSPSWSGGKSSGLLCTCCCRGCSRRRRRSSSPHLPRPSPGYVGPAGLGQGHRYLGRLRPRADLAPARPSHLQRHTLAQFLCQQLPGRTAWRSTRRGRGAWQDTTPWGAGVSGWARAWSPSSHDPAWE